jgi:glycosyltransferase involved in cell wall biosynthesis
VAGLNLAEMPEIVTYATRGMEPQRGFPQFMRALANLQTQRPGLHAIIVGDDRVAYGRQLPEGETWKSRMLAECDLDMSRTHFTGLLPRGDYIRVLQASQAHVYLTVPFVLSWSMLEAMSVGCPLVAADVAPVTEVVTHDREGVLIDFRKPGRIEAAVTALLDAPETAARLGANARALILERYELETTVAAKIAMLEAALGPRAAPGM